MFRQRIFQMRIALHINLLDFVMWNSNKNYVCVLSASPCGSYASVSNDHCTVLFGYAARIYHSRRHDQHPNGLCELWCDKFTIAHLFCVSRLCQTAIKWFFFLPIGQLAAYCLVTDFRAHFPSHCLTIIGDLLFAEPFHLTRRWFDHI